MKQHKKFKKSIDSNVVLDETNLVKKFNYLILCRHGQMYSRAIQRGICYILDTITVNN